ncbi:MAG TPA: serine/threonine-protein kinase [Kofleriaceae bacterium]|nr:serine/threonine-protein kinase [Kofleriaceae bacterium]
MSSIVPGVTVEDRFVIERIAGAGGMGRVFYGFDASSEQPVAVKILADGLDEELERFWREAEILAQIDHPGLAKYVAHGTWEGTPYLVQDWIEGITLAKYLAGTGCTVREAVVVGRVLAETLAVLHGLGIIHRDVKPSNVILVNGEIAKPRLVDFGIARRIEDAVAHSLTRTGSFLGTPGYTSPEQVQGKKSIGPPADLFALGAILYESVTGAPGFAGINGIARNTKVVMLDPPAIGTYCPEAPAELVATIERLLRKDPAERFQSASEVVAALPAVDALPDDLHRRRGWQEGMQTIRPQASALGTPRMSLGVQTGHHIACVILAVPTHRSEHDCSAIASAYGMTAQVHEDGSVTALGTGDDRIATATAAARCALALAATLEKSPIVVVSYLGEQGESVSVVDALEWAFEVLEVWGVRLAVEPDDVVGVRIDDATAGALPPRFHVTRDGAAIHLLGEDAA